MLKNRTTRQRPPHIGNIEAIIATHVRGQPSRLPPQRRLRLRRHHPRHHRPRPTSLPPRHHRHRLDNHMRISATNPKRRHPRTTRPSTSRPHPRRGQQLHRPRRPIHMRARHIHVQRRRQQLMAHRQHHLDHPGHPRRGLRMTHIRLHRPQPQRFSRLPPILPISGQQRLSLNRIPQRGPGPMPLHHIHLGRAQPGIGQRRPHHPLLRRTIRRGQPIRRPILINRRPDHHRQHRMTQPPRIRKPLQHQHPTALGPADPISPPGVRLAPAVGCQPTMPAEFHEDRRCGVDGDAASQRQIALPRPQRSHRHMQRHQRRRTRRIHRHRRTLQPQHIGHPTRGDAGMQRHQRRRTRRIHRHRRTLQPQHIGHPTRGDAGQLAGQPEAFYRLGGEHAVALRHYPGEYPGGAAAQSGRIDTGPLQRLPGQLQQHPLLGVHREGLARPHPEEGGVEVADPVHKAAGAGVARTRGVGVGVV